MVTRVVGSKKRDNTGDFISEWYGLSTDTKPVYADGARNADSFMEMDTMSVHFFDEDSDSWVG